MKLFICNFCGDASDTQVCDTCAKLACDKNPFFSFIEEEKMKIEEEKMKECTCDSIDLFKGGCLCGYLDKTDEIDIKVAGYGQMTPPPLPHTVTGKINCSCDFTSDGTWQFCAYCENLYKGVSYLSIAEALLTEDNKLLEVWRSRYTGEVVKTEVTRSYLKEAVRGRWSGTGFGFESLGYLRIL